MGRPEENGALREQSAGLPIQACATLNTTPAQFIRATRAHVRDLIRVCVTGVQGKPRNAGAIEGKLATRYQ
jgi:hypothetical protein